MGTLRLRGRWLKGTLIAMSMVILGAVPASAHEHLIVGGQGVVSNTNGDGVNVRTDPNLDSSVHFVATEGQRVSITSGPQDAAGYSWYGVHANGTDGWIVGDFLARPAIQAGNQVTVVNTDGHGLRVRADAALDATTLTVIPEGTTVDVVGEQRTDGGGGVWANVSYGGQTGFAYASYLVLAGGGGGDAQVAAAEQQVEAQPAPTSGIAVDGNVQIVDTNGDGLNIRAGAGYGHSVVTVAAEGDVAHVIGGPTVDADGVNWWNVDYKGLNGWAHGGYLAATDLEVTNPSSAQGAAATGEGGADAESAPASSNVGQAIVNTAMQHLGAPYVWGGTTPSGFDCSGFLYYVVNQATGGGFSRVLESQVVSGTHVPADQLQPGDLVFQQNTYKWGLSHSGIYIGNGQFIHAANPSTGVTISNLWDSYWGQRFYTARRIS